MEHLISKSIKFGPSHTFLSSSDFYLCLPRQGTSGLCARIKAPPAMNSDFSGSPNSPVLAERSSPSETFPFDSNKWTLVNWIKKQCLAFSDACCSGSGCLMNNHNDRQGPTERLVLSGMCCDQLYKVWAVTRLYFSVRWRVSLNCLSWGLEDCIIKKQQTSSSLCVSSNKTT